MNYQPIYIKKQILLKNSLGNINYYVAVDISISHKLCEHHFVETNLWVPPVSHFSDKCGIYKICPFLLGIVYLVKDEIEVTTGTVDIVQQKVRGYKVLITVPLGENSGKKSGGERIGGMSSKNVGIKCFIFEYDAVKFILRLKTETPTRSEVRDDLKTASLAAKKFTKIHNKQTGNHFAVISRYKSLEGSEIILSGRNNNPLSDLKVLIETIKSSLNLAIKPLKHHSAFKFTSGNESEVSGF